MPMRERIADETRPAYFAARDDGLVVFRHDPEYSWCRIESESWRGYYENKRRDS